MRDCPPSSHLPNLGAQIPWPLICVINATALSRRAARRVKRKWQRQWQQKPENQNYFRSPENSQRVKEWRKRNPSYRRK
jgi:hypothetical protein